MAPKIQNPPRIRLAEQNSAERGLPHVDAQGRLSNNRVFMDMPSEKLGVFDGMKVTRDGHLFCTNPRGIWVIDSQGQRLGVIRVPDAPQSLAFSDSDACTLYITAGKSSYILPTKVVGIGAFDGLGPTPFRANSQRLRPAPGASESQEYF